MIHISLMRRSLYKGIGWWRQLCQQTWYREGQRSSKEVGLYIWIHKMAHLRAKLGQAPSAALATRNRNTAKSATKHKCRARQAHKIDRHERGTRCRAQQRCQVRPPGKQAETFPPSYANMSAKVSWIELKLTETAEQSGGD